MAKTPATNAPPTRSLNSAACAPTRSLHYTTGATVPTKNTRHSTTIRIPIPGEEQTTNTVSPFGSGLTDNEVTDRLFGDDLPGQPDGGREHRCGVTRTRLHQKRQNGSRRSGTVRTRLAAGNRRSRDSSTMFDFWAAGKNASSKAQWQTCAGNTCEGVSGGAEPARYAGRGPDRPPTSSSCPLRARNPESGPSTFAGQP